MNPIFTKAFKAATALVLGLSMFSPATHAAVLAYEGFNYSAGYLNGSNGGFGWDSAWNDEDSHPIVTNPGLTYPGGEGDSGYAAVGNALTMTGAQYTARAVYGLGLGDQAGASQVYMSALLKPISNAGSNTLQFHFDTSVGDVGLIYWNGWGGASETGYWQIQASDGGPFVDSNKAVSLGTTVHAVLGFSFSGDSGADTISLWIDPGATLGTPNAVYAGMDIGNISRVGILSQGGNWQIDEIQIANTAPTLSVPEPSELALMAGGIGLLGFSRRRKNS